MYSKPCSVFIDLSLHQILITLIMNKFTRKMMLAIACIIAGCINVQAQYQLPNPGFEGTWKETTWGAIGKSTENVPQYWHSFGTAAGSLKFYKSLCFSKYRHPHRIR